MKTKKSWLIMYFFTKTIVALAITFYILFSIFKANVPDSLILNAASQYCDAPLAQIIEKNGNVVYVQCYELVDDGISIHTATLGLLEANAITGKTTDLLTEETINIYEYLNEQHIFNAQTKEVHR